VARFGRPGVNAGVETCPDGLVRGGAFSGKELSYAASNIPGLKPPGHLASIAALKRRSSTALQASVAGAFAALRRRAHRKIAPAA
jgi:hypothetical protein